MTWYYALGFEDRAKRVTLRQITGGGRILVTDGMHSWWTWPKRIKSHWHAYRASFSQRAQLYSTLTEAERVATNLNRAQVPIPSPSVEDDNGQ